MTNDETVQLEVGDHIARVVLNRPEKHNAIDGSMMSGLVDAAAAIAADRSVRVVVLSGAGPSFCAGLDSSNFAAMVSGDLAADNDRVQEAYADRSPQGANRAQQVGWAWHELEVPVIAAVHGNALGGGFNLALGADIRVVAPDATFGFVEVTWGLIPDMSASQSLRRLVGAERAKYLMMTGRRFSGAEALQWGLAAELADDPTARAYQLASELTAHNPDALRAVKAVIDASIDLDTAGGLDLETVRSGALLGSTNQVEAVMARLEDRPAEFD
ncbi:MAG: crotonase/enoyl-CoA hydratase family protein [Acidimicrobiales bacterium]